MKLLQIVEAKYTNPRSARLAWYELGDSRGHPFWGKAVVSLEDLDKLHQLGDTPEGEDAYDDYFSDKDIFSPSEVMFTGWKEIRASIQKTGEASGVWEEGTFGISAKGMKRAKQLAALAYHATSDDDEEDWY